MRWWKGLPSTSFHVSAPLKILALPSMKLKEFSFLFRTAVENGAGMALAKTGALRPFLTKAEAYRLYGRSDVDRWIAEGLLHPNTRKLIDREKLAQVAAASNRVTYLPTAER